MRDPVALERRMTVCADDYGLAPGVGQAIRELIAAGRLSATSCMTVTTHWPDEAARLKPLAGDIEVGLHLTLTDHPPLGSMPRLAPTGRLPPLPTLIARSLTGTLDPDETASEIDRQIAAFIAHLGCPPDFLDGHQHIHQLPQIRAAVFGAFNHHLRRTGGWLRYATMPWTDVRHHWVAAERVAAINLLGAGFRRRGHALGIPGNGWFRGVRSFQERAPYRQLLTRLVRGVEGPGLLMCHPGMVDKHLQAVDPVTTPREDEFRALLSPAFPTLIEDLGYRLGGVRAERCGQAVGVSAAAISP